MNQDKIKEETIESLAMAVTHSEQGEYAKNEAYVTKKIDNLIAHLSAQYEKLIEEVIPKESDPERLVMHDAFCDCEDCSFRNGFNNALFSIRTSLQERGIKIK